MPSSLLTNEHFHILVCKTKSAIFYEERQSVYKYYLILNFNPYGLYYIYISTS